jgi:hypothetical protein
LTGGVFTIGIFVLFRIDTVIDQTCSGSRFGSGKVIQLLPGLRRWASEFP